MSECPNCGCNDIERAGRRVQWGRSWQQWRCQSCGHEWNDADAECSEGGEKSEFVSVVVSETVLTHCGKRANIYSVRQIGATRVRYWRCQVCGATSKTTEHI